MGQSFPVINIDKQVIFNNAGKFGEWWPQTNTGDGRYLAERLVPSVTIFPDDPLKDVTSIGAAKQSNTTQTGLCDLATELHVLIFGHLDDPIDVMTASLTCIHFWKVGIARFKALYEAYALQKYYYSGDRFIVLGGYAYDWPEGAFTGSEIRQMEENGLVLDSEDHYNISRVLYSTYPKRTQLTSWPTRAEFGVNCPLKRVEYLRPASPYSVAGPEGPSNTRRAWMKSERAKRLEVPLYGAYDFSEWFKEPKRAYMCSEDRRGPCVLRNISKKLYVRADVLALHARDVDGPYIKGMSFASLITARAVWSSDPSMSTVHTQKNDNFHRGPWAGDRFDIVAPSKVENLEDWTDVSLEAKKELTAMWKSQYGHNWEEKYYKD